MRLFTAKSSRAIGVITLLLSQFFTLDQANAGLYSFTSHTFTTCSATGNTGPVQASCRTAYSTTWDEADANYTVVSGIQMWTVPASGTYRIKAVGAAGGGYGAGFYGMGASIQGDFSLTQGEILKILVGQQGVTNASYGQGGGGGSFVTKSNDTILVIAGGGGSMSNGGGDAGSSRTARACGDASLTTSGMPGCFWIGYDTVGGAGGTSGSGGGAITSSWNGHAGAGFLGNAPSGGATQWSSGMLGGTLTTYALGGFGGGGAGGMYGGSGGGGYSGGGASSRHAHGGGGGSYNSGVNKVETLTATATNGNVLITFIAAAITDSTISLVAPSTYTYRSASTITATVNAPGRVTFFANGKRIPGCIAVKTVSSGTITATCAYKPSSRGVVSISASLAPTDTTAFRPSSISLARSSISSRSGNR